MAKERAAQGCLLLHDLTAGPGQLNELAQAVEEAGIPASVPDLYGFTPRDAYDRTPQWQRWLTEAQEAYVELRGVSDRVTIAGVGAGGVIATVLAEQYAAEGLVVLGSVDRPRSAAAALKRYLPLTPLEGSGGRARTLDVGRLVRLANNNLFSVIADVLVVEAGADPLYAPGGGEKLLNGVRAGRKETVTLEGAAISTMCETHAKELRRALLCFLKGEPV